MIANINNFTSIRTQDQMIRFFDSPSQSITKELQSLALYGMCYKRIVMNGKVTCYRQCSGCQLHIIGLRLRQCCCHIKFSMSRYYFTSNDLKCFKICQKSKCILQVYMLSGETINCEDRPNDDLVWFFGYGTMEPDIRCQWRT